MVSISVDMIVLMVLVRVMFGKHFTSMYEGSMIGKGSAFFAVWGYVIAHTKPSRMSRYGGYVELNPVLLGFVLGEKREVVEAVIEEMCGPDEKSRSREAEGRKLIKVGEYGYDVVNWLKYREIRDEETRRAQNRDAKRRQRAKNGKPQAGEAGYVKVLEVEGKAAADAWADRVVK
jgi:hypothetical protein